MLDPHSSFFPPPGVKQRLLAPHFSQGGCVSLGLVSSHVFPRPGAVSLPMSNFAVVVASDARTVSVLRSIICLLRRVFAHGLLTATLLSVHPPCTLSLRIRVLKLLLHKKFFRSRCSVVPYRHGLPYTWRPLANLPFYQILPMLSPIHVTSHNIIQSCPPSSH